jgi:anaerobic magnesium-protoporphyrin IX monomethyl ester cyclase
MTDCVLVGHNDGKFSDYVKMVEEMGVRSGAYRDLALSFVTWDGEPTRALDVFNRLNVPDSYGQRRKYHNLELLWPTITYLGSYLNRAGFSFDYVNLFQDEQEEFRAKLAEGPRSVAITTTLHVTPYPVIEVVRFVRNHAPGTPVIVGGPFVANYARQWDTKGLSTVFSIIDADIYINSSEGELALTRVLQALRSGHSLRGIPNVIFREGSEFVFNDTETESNDLAANMVDYSLFNPLGEFVSLRTAKSCPYSCAFCGFPARAGKYVYLPPKLVEAELDAIAEQGSVTSLTFLDDTCNVPKGRFKKVLRMMIEKQYGFRWNCFYRSDHGDEEVIELMAEAGCEGVFLGVESGSDTMLETMNKTARRSDYMKAIPLLKKAGIVTHANLIIGFPGENERTVAETRSLLEEARPDFFRAQLWYADPITPVWSRRNELGIEGSMFNWSHRTMDSATATDLVDDLFCTVRGSVWLPQSGFELWSVYYLQRRGMIVDQVKGVLRAFNSAVLENVGRGRPRELSQAARTRLEAAYRFEPRQPAARPAAVSIRPAAMSQVSA